jgi:DNA-binding MarR family transcriptional regulator
MTRPNKQELMVELIAAVRANQLATDKMDDTAARGMGVNRTDARCLDIVERLGPVTAGALAADAGLTSGAATAAIDRLEAKGYVRRVGDPTDRRRVLIEKTAKLEEAAGRFYGPLAERSVGPLSQYSTAELETLIRFLRFSTSLVEDRVVELLEERGKQGRS